ncbi:hypothetical protein LSH36_119g13033 [Paralvinella palmiformis]|uniref:FLYWCH-type domain-containing protein n=1 Tax=Paralvinella palmiformis TaxID=53620 RepID=A0AAD9JY81_9ANNE|nr:hypothetical protein LSH36_119g13033 [Paralvinella palmiformis]
MEVFTSNKGGQKILLGGFIYTKQITKPRNIRWRCVQRTTDCKAILTTTVDLDDPNSEARVHIGREESVKGTLRNQRLGRIPAEPDSLQDLIIDGESAQTSEHNPQHLIYDNVPDTDSQIIVFGASDALKHLSTANTWYMDGNRAVAPRGFCQLYIIRCLLGNTVVSAIYALLKRVTRYLREPDMCHC